LWWNYNEDLLEAAGERSAVAAMDAGRLLSAKAGNPSSDDVKLPGTKGGVRLSGSSVAFTHCFFLASSCSLSWASCSSCFAGTN